MAAPDAQRLSIDQMTASGELVDDLAKELSAVILAAPGSCILVPVENHAYSVGSNAR
jgi:hypothetical protein